MVSISTGTETVYKTPDGQFTVTTDYNGQQGLLKMNNLTVPWANYDFTWYNYNYMWSSIDPEPIITYNKDVDDTIRLVTKLKASGEPGCPDTTSYIYNLRFRTLFVPNGFDPTSTKEILKKPDGGYFPPDYLFNAVGANLKQYHIQIFDSFGRLMWESTDLLNGMPSGGWDGNYQGQPMPQGNYVWRIAALFNDDLQWEGATSGTSATKKTLGSFVLLRNN